MPLARIAGKILFLAHVPRTGGTSLTAYMAAKGATALHSPDVLGWARTSAAHIHADVHRMLVPEAFCDASFAVIRDPMARLQSAYNYRRDRKLITGDFEPWAAVVLSLVGQDPDIIDNHIRPQVDFLRWNMHVFDFKAGLAPVFNWIDRHTATPQGPRDARLNVATVRKLTTSPEIEALVQRVYAEDYALLKALQGGEGRNGSRLRELKA